MWTDLALGPSFKVKTMVHWLLVSCLSGGYKFASVLRCVGLVVSYITICKHLSKTNLKYL